MIAAPVWTAKQLEKERLAAIEAFRKERLEEPLEAYLLAFDHYQAVVQDLLASTVDLTRLDDRALQVLTDDRLLEAFRYLPGPPISTDDLKIVAEARSLNKTALQTDAALVQRIAQVVLAALDCRRFLWMAEDRRPTEADRSRAKCRCLGVNGADGDAACRNESAQQRQEAPGAIS